MQTVSVIVATLNRPALVLDAIQSAVHQTRAPLEVIAVDDGSDPPVDTADLKARFGSTLRILRNAHPEGLAWARHQGATAARGDYVVHLDDDDLFAPNLVEECASVLDADPSIDLVFIGTQGFGQSSAHFNTVHPAGTARVVQQGGGTAWQDSTYLFGPDLFRGLLNQVPMPFQRVMVRRHVWNKVSLLRQSAYQVAFDLTSAEAARNKIRGTLRDSEWALYAALACRQTALVDRPLYLQRCEGQGRSSLAEMRQRHIRQNLEIRTVLTRASGHLSELRAFRREIAQNLANSHFDAAYEFIGLGQYAASLRHLGRNIRLDPSLRAAKLLLKLGLSGVFRKPAP